MRSTVLQLAEGVEETRMTEQNDIESATRAIRRVVGRREAGGQVVEGRVDGRSDSPRLWPEDDADPRGSICCRSEIVRESGARRCLRLWCARILHGGSPISFRAPPCLCRCLGDSCRENSTTLESASPADEPGSEKEAG